MNISDYFLTIQETAKALNTTRQTISRWIREDKFKAQRVGREVLIPKKEVESLLKERIKQAEEIYAEFSNHHHVL